MAAGVTLPYWPKTELETAGTSFTSVIERQTAPHFQEDPRVWECKEWGTLQIGGNRLGSVWPIKKASHVAR